MRCVLGAVLAAALLVVSAHSLSCYSCSNGPTEAACKTAINCSSDLDSYCEKVVDNKYVYSETSSFSFRSASPTPTSSVGNEPVGKDYELDNTYRGCSALCRGGEGKKGDDYYSYVYCCSTDLCNGANTVRIIAILLPLAAALLLSAGL